MNRQVFELPVGERSGEIEPQANIEILTFTGIDRLISVDEVFEIHDRYPKVEFGLLVTKGHSHPSNRFPDMSLVSDWRNLAQKYQLPLAIHLCGDFAEDIMAGEGIETVLPLCSGFSRVQINSENYNYQRVAEFAEAVDCQRVILQRQGPLDLANSLVHPKVEYLFDVSRGNGRESFSDWSVSDQIGGRQGFAGGLGPKNINQALEFVGRFPGRRFWLDIESGVRTADDWLDLGQVASVCGQVFPGR